MDSGIEASHPHFLKFGNVDAVSPWHRDFTVDGSGPLGDLNGHGTHVAGIIAGEWSPQAVSPPRKAPIAISRSLEKDTQDVGYHETYPEGIKGMAPECKLVSLKVLDEDGNGAVSNLIAAIAHLQEINDHGR